MLLVQAHTLRNTGLPHTICYSYISTDSNNPERLDISIPISLMRKLRLTKIEYIAQRHTANEDKLGFSPLSNSLVPKPKSLEIWHSYSHHILNVKQYPPPQWMYLKWFVKKERNLYPSHLQTSQPKNQPSLMGVKTASCPLFKTQLSGTDVPLIRLAVWQAIKKSSASSSQHLQLITEPNSSSPRIPFRRMV